MAASFRIHVYTIPKLLVVGRVLVGWIEDLCPLQAWTFGPWPLCAVRRVLVCVVLCWLVSFTWMLFLAGLLTGHINMDNVDVNNKLNQVYMNIMEGDLNNLTGIRALDYCLVVCSLTITACFLAGHLSYGRLARPTNF